MERIFIYIKHHLHFLWDLFEWFNGFLFGLFYKSEIGEILPQVFTEFSNPPFIYRKLDLSDIDQLSDLLKSQAESDLIYFHPHDFDLKTLEKQIQKSAFLMMGVFIDKRMIGYFFLRFFINKKCFVGRLIDFNHRGQNIGKVMNAIMYEIAWRMDFRCLSTISRDNKSIMRAHSKNEAMIVLKELPNNYLLVEFIKGK